ncbi:uncharacterized protein LOC111312371 [Durio zibethinus]|uniref:Uncharacterized protein LOC111312371 n=1 Tax=Durio zibethinus TaxID=66656 RepID=A0A6P6AU11_DURZI|nr:uncharacterized protein LOC111312371 [Durio zibethinus]
MEICGKDQYKHIPKIPTPTDRDEYGNQKSVSRAEVVLNWQTENSLQQNSYLHRIEHKLDQVSQHFDQSLVNLQNIILEIQSRIITLDQELRYMAENNTGIIYAFTEREKEMKSLKIQLADLQNQFRQKQQQQQAASSYNIFTPYHTGMHDTPYQAYTLPAFQPYNPPTSPPKPFFTHFQYKPPPTSIPTSSQPTQYFTPLSEQPDQLPFGTTEKWIHRFREKQPVDPKPKRVAEQPLNHTQAQVLHLKTLHHNQTKNLYNS